MAKKPSRRSTPRRARTDGSTLALTPPASKPGERTRHGDASPVAAARRRGPRTAGGKKMDPAVLEKAEHDSRAALRERTEEGHLKAGRTPPSQQTETRRPGATRVIDDAIRDYVLPVTEDEQPLQSASPRTPSP